MNHRSHNVQVFCKFICSFGTFFKKERHNTFFRYFSCQSFTKSKSQVTLILGLSTGSGNCYKFTEDYSHLTEQMAQVVARPQDFERRQREAR